MTTKTSLAADAARLRTSLANVVGSMSRKQKQKQDYDALFFGTDPETFREVVADNLGIAVLCWQLASAAYIGARADSEERVRGN